MAKKIERVTVEQLALEFGENKEGGPVCTVINGDCLDLMQYGVDALTYKGLTPVIVTDPPFNMGYKYRTYRDKMAEGDYYKMLAEVTGYCSSVVILYPESLHRLSIEKQEKPDRVMAWVYNSNTPRQHRDIAFYGIKPDFKRVLQPYKDYRDKRIQERIKQGHLGAALYDWVQINQVKGNSKEKTAHPCQMPLDLMDKLVRLLPDGIGVIDPFCGSGTTGVACKRNGIDFIGYELDTEYCKIAIERVNNAV